MAVNVYERRAMLERDRLAVDLVVALLLAFVLNGVFWVGAAAWALGPRVGTKLSAAADQATVKKADAKAKSPLTLGKDDAKTPSIAWISYQSFKKLEAKKSETQQPALQDKVTPVKHALPRLNPTPPAPNQKATRAASASVQMPAAAHEAASASAMRGLDQQLVDVGEVPFAKVSNRRGRASKVNGQTGKAEAEAQAKQPAKQPAKAAAAGGAVKSAARPTSAAKSQSESSLTSFIEHVHPIEPGRVVVGPGIEVETKVPEFSAVTLASSLPRNPEADITFNAKGRVIDVKITRSSTFPNVDSSIEQCLYRWRATGKAIKRVHGPFTLHMKVLLMSE